MTLFKNLLVWQKAHELAKAAIQAAIKIRSTHFASVRQQIIRAACSIPTNIVEGSAQESRKEFGRFLRYAFNSANELEYHFILAHDAKLMTERDFATLSAQVIEVQKMLSGLMRKLREE